MSDTDKLLVVPADFTAALGLLSRIPVAPPHNDRGAAVAWTFPLVGILLAIIAGLLGHLALWFGFSAPITAGLVLVALIMLTGGMHEDGLADSADGLWGGNDKKRRLEIMKDSHIGTYGVIALVMSLIIRWTALSALINAGALFAPLIAASALSRVSMVALMFALPPARDKGLSAGIGQVKSEVLWLATGIALLLGLLMIGWGILAVCAAVAVAALIMAILANRKITGQTGDILGASQQLSEIAALITLAALLP